MNSGRKAYNEKSDSIYSNATDNDCNMSALTQGSEEIHDLERQLFLRAALQLLDERENAHHHSSNNTNANQDHNKQTANRYTFRPDVIRFGKLKKANRRNALTAMGPRVWKNKIVEVKYGILFYEDDFNGSRGDMGALTLPLQALQTNNNINTSKEINHNNNNNNDTIYRKSIILSSSTTYIKVVKSKGVHENCVFQIATLGGLKRTFLASSPDDRESWIRAVLTAMPAVLSPRNILRNDNNSNGLGSGGGGERFNDNNTDNSSRAGLSLSSHNPVAIQLNQQLTQLNQQLNQSIIQPLKKKQSFTTGLFKPTKKKPTDANNYLASQLFDKSSSDHGLMYLTLTSSPGPAAKYARDIEVFCDEQAKLTMARTEEQYKRCVLSLRETNATVHIPVFFVKNVRNADDDSLQDFHMTAQDNRIIKETSDNQKPQVWKDLQRDQVMINDELISGQTRGADGIVAALTRHILTCAENCRKCSQNYGYSTAATTGTGVGGHDVYSHMPSSPSTPGRSNPSSSLRQTPGASDTVSAASRSHSNSGGGSGSSNAGTSAANSGSSLLSRLTARKYSTSNDDRDKDNNSEPPLSPVESAYHYPSTGNTAAAATANSFVLSEAHALSCAKDILLLCSRTQSAGDAYFCVESFLAKCGMDTFGKDRYCHLMPLDADSSPLEFMIHVGLCSPGAEIVVLPEINTNYPSFSSTGFSSLSSGTPPLEATDRDSRERDRGDVNKVRQSIRGAMRTRQRNKMSYVDSLNMGMSMAMDSTTGGSGSGEPLLAGALSVTALGQDTKPRTDTSSTSSSSHMEASHKANSSISSNNNTTNTSSSSSFIPATWKGRFFPIRPSSTTSGPSRPTLSPRTQRIGSSDSLSDSSTTASAADHSRHVPVPLSSPTSASTTTATTSESATTAVTSTDSEIFNKDNKAHIKAKAVSSALAPSASVDSTDATATTVVSSPLSQENVKKHEKLVSKLSSSTAATGAAAVAGGGDHHHGIDYENDDVEDGSSDYDETIVDIEDDDFSVASEVVLEESEVAEQVDVNTIQAMLGNMHSPTVAAALKDYDKGSAGGSGGSDKKSGRSGTSSPLTRSPPEKPKRVTSTSSSSSSSAAAAGAVSASGSSSPNSPRQCTVSPLLLVPLSADDKDKPWAATSDTHRLPAIHDVSSSAKSSNNSSKHSADHITPTSSADSKEVQPPPPNNAPELEYDTKTTGGRTSSLHRLLPTTKSFKNTVFGSSPFTSSTHSKATATTSSSSSSSSSSTNTSLALLSNSASVVSTSASSVSSSHMIADKDSVHLSLVLSATQHRERSDRYELSGSHTSQASLGVTSYTVSSSGNEEKKSDIDLVRHQYAIEPLDTIHRRKSSLCCIYESQLSMLYQPTRPPELVIRVLMRSETRYRLCCADNPQGDDSDNWATVVATFEQSFLLHGNSLGVPVALDRVVSIEFERDVRKSQTVDNNANTAAAAAAVNKSASSAVAVAPGKSLSSSPLSLPAKLTSDGQSISADHKHDSSSDSASDSGSSSSRDHKRFQVYVVDDEAKGKEDKSNETRY